MDTTIYTINKYSYEIEEYRVIEDFPKSYSVIRKDNSLPFPYRQRILKMVIGHSAYIDRVEAIKAAKVMLEDKIRCTKDTLAKLCEKLEEYKNV